MPRRGSPRRHAQAVFQLALQSGEMEGWLAHLEAIARVATEPGYRAVLESPRLSLKDKLSVAGDKLAGLSPLAVNFLGLLLARGRLGMAPQIAEEYRRLLYAHQGVELAEVVTAVPLEAGEEALLAQRLERLTGKKVKLALRTDSAILGGLVARMGDRLLDGSVRSRLHALKKSLAAGGR